jgi:co-chaperonin GroES (HSP10)
MKNKSGINPVGFRILVLPEDVEEVTESGIVIHTATTKKEEQAITEGIVIDIGSEAYADKKSAWCKIGDRIIFAKYAGFFQEGKDGKKYRVINDLEVVAVLK